MLMFKLLPFIIIIITIIVSLNIKRKLFRFYGHLLQCNCWVGLKL